MELVGWINAGIDDGWIWPCWMEEWVGWWRWFDG